MNRPELRARAAVAWPALLLAFAATATATVAFADRAPTDWAGAHSVPTVAQAARAADALRLLPRVQRTTPLSVTEGGDPGGTWSLVGPQAGVQRFQPAVIVDPVRQRLVSFGGSNDVVRSDTWVFALANGLWSPLATAGEPPPARRLHGAVYDSNADRMIVFGGVGDGGLLSDVWQLSLSGTPTWSPLPATGSPGARAGSVCAFDAAGNRLLVFGGYDGDTLTFGCTNDVWALPLTGTPEWTELQPAGGPPAPRLGMVGGFDAWHQALYVFGGEDTTQSAQLWELDLSGPPAWSLVVPAGAGPPARAYAAGGFDPVTLQFVVTGGLSVWFSPDGENFVPTTYGDVWAIAPHAASPAWNDITPDPSVIPRWGAGSAVSPAGDLYMVGGVSEHYQLLADVWKLHVGGPYTWQGYEDLFPPRLQEVMVMDPARHRLVAFGGTDGSYRNDTYVHSLDSGRGWAFLPTTGTPPSPRRLHTGIWDEQNDRLVVFGGFDGGFFQDVWQLSFATTTPTWSLVPTTGTPPSPRAGHVAIYDAANRRMIVSNGYDGVTPPNNRIGDSFALSLDGPAVWTPLTTASIPGARSSATAVYDPAGERMLMFGGTNPDFLDECWALSLSGTPAWTELAPAGGPPAREEHAAVYDASRDRMVIFGGYDTPTPFSNNYADLWSLGLAGVPAWSALAPAGTSPSPRWGMKAVYDPGADGMWMYGGWDWTYSQQLWFLQWSQPVATLPVATTQALATSGRAALQWQLPVAARSSAVVQRSSDGVHWSRVGRVLPHGLALPFTDRTVTGGQSYAWRTVVSENGRRMASSPVWLTIPQGTTVVPPPAARFALRPGGASVRAGAVAVVFALPSRASGRLQLLDIAGRVRDARDLSSLDAGEHRAELGAGLESGVYFVRLTSGARSASLKSLVIR